MSRVAHKQDMSTRKDVKYVYTSSAVGKCLRCEKQLSYCGKPFSAELRCPNCGALNVYEESQQPIRLAA